MEWKWQSDVQAIDTIPVNAALLAADSRIIAVNGRWADFARRNGLGTPAAGVGTRYLDVCLRGLGAEHRFTSDLRRLLRGQTLLITWTYECSGPEQDRWFTVMGVPASQPGASALLLHIDVTSLLPETVKPQGIAWTRSALAPQDAVRPEHASASPARPGARTRRKIMRLLASGCSTSEIVERTGLTRVTVDRHVEAILRQLAITDRDVAVRMLAQAYAKPRGSI